MAQPVRPRTRDLSGVHRRPARRPGTWYPRGVDRDGNGWARCSRGHRHWGRHGAAGLLLHAVDDEGVVRVLLQHRAAWTHHGDTWGLPGGARDSHEDGASAALREAVEEAGLDPGRIRTRHLFVDDHGGWSYTTVYADVPRPVTTTANRESAALEWVPLDQVAALPLHPGFALTWPQVLVRPTVLLVDAANVVGARPDGWWRDRAGATSRLLDALAQLRAATVRGPGGDPRVIRAVVAVLEGAAVSAGDSDWVRVHRAQRGSSGDDVLVVVAAQLLADGNDVLAVSADRGLRARWESLTGQAGAPDAQVAGPRWLLGALEGTAPSGAQSAGGSMRP
jgi:8-oxo-dGTP diphosphatase